MMRRHFAPALLLIAAAFTAVPNLAMAQNKPAAAHSGADPAAIDDLRCAMIFAAMLESVSEDNPEAAAGVTALMTYFIGRYEAQSNRDLTEAMLEQVLVMDEFDSAALGLACSERGAELSVRMTDAGQALVALGTSGS